MPPPKQAKKKVSTIGIPAPNRPRLPAISTPLPSGTKMDGQVAKITINNIHVTILPDKFVPDKNIKGGATSEKHNGISLSWKPDKQHLIKTFTLSPINVEIKTIYRTGVNPLDRSAYGSGTVDMEILLYYGFLYAIAYIKKFLHALMGRDTTQDDKEIEAIEVGSLPLYYHEGSHGYRYLRFFEENPPPTFTGKVGMTEVAFKQAFDVYQKEMKAYFREVQLRQWRDVDCVGTPDSETFKDGSTCSTLATPNPKYK